MCKLNLLLNQKIIKNFINEYSDLNLTELICNNFTNCFCENISSNTIACFIIEYIIKSNNKYIINSNKFTCRYIIISNMLAQVFKICYFTEFKSLRLKINLTCKMFKIIYNLDKNSNYIVIRLLDLIYNMCFNVEYNSHNIYNSLSKLSLINRNYINYIKLFDNQ